MVGSIATDQLKGLSLNLISCLCAIFMYIVPAGFAGFLPPPRNMPVDELAKNNKNCPVSMCVHAFWTWTGILRRVYS